MQHRLNVQCNARNHYRSAADSPHARQALPESGFDDLVGMSMVPRSTSRRTIFIGQLSESVVSGSASANSRFSRVISLAQHFELLDLHYIHPGIAASPSLQRHRDLGVSGELFVSSLPAAASSSGGRNCHEVISGMVRAGDRSCLPVLCGPLSPEHVTPLTRRNSRPRSYPQGRT